MNLDAAAAVAAWIRERGGKAVAFACHVADHSACEKFAREVEASLGPASLLVNNADILIQGAILQITKSFAVELAHDGIWVNAFAHGIIATPMTVVTRADPEKVAAFLRDVPMDRVGEAEEMVGPVVFLASELSSYVIGTIMLDDGGFLAV